MQVRLKLPVPTVAGGARDEVAPDGVEEAADKASQLGLEVDQSLADVTHVRWAVASMVAVKGRRPLSPINEGERGVVGSRRYGSIIVGGPLYPILVVFFLSFTTFSLSLSLSYGARGDERMVREERVDQRREIGWCKMLPRLKRVRFCMFVWESWPLRSPTMSHQETRMRVEIGTERMKHTNNMNCLSQREGYFVLYLLVLE